MSTVKTNQLTSPIVARFVRILPTSWNADICLRAEFYGCPGKHTRYMSLIRTTDDNVGVPISSTFVQK